MKNSFFNLLSHGKLTILQFHKVPRTAHVLDPFDLDLAGFESVLQATMSLFNIRPLDEAVLSLRAGNLPSRTACITFDDGYVDWIDGVVPVLEKNNTHATFFITTGQFSGVPLWNERILHAIHNFPEGASSLNLGGGLDDMEVATLVQKQSAVQKLQRALKYYEPARREQFLQVLESIAGCVSSQVPVLSTSGLKSIHAKGFGIGAHSLTHPILSRCTPKKAYQEIAESREELQSLIGGPVKAFAYPNGISGKDFGPEHIEMVRQAGFSMAFTTHRGVATGDSSVLQLPRFSPWGPTIFKMKFQFAKNLYKKTPLIKEGSPAKKKNILMVAFHFPPQSGSSGILRTLNFVKYLPENGWQPIVLTATARAYTEQRNDLVASIPSQTKIIRGFALDAARHLSIGGKYPLILALPDRWSSWWLGTVWAGLRLIREQRPDIIWSTYPISTAHWIGSTLSRFSGLPWVIDFRDPMVTADYPDHKLQRRLWSQMENRFMHQATACIFTTQRAASSYALRYPEMAKKCRVIENGFEEEIFENTKPNRSNIPEDCLLMLHSGLIYPKDRNPSHFFAAVQSLVASGQLDRTKLRIRFRAPQHGDEVCAFATKYGLQDIVEVEPPISYQDAISEMMGADALIVFQGRNFNAQIPAKIYEYIRAQRPVLALLDPVGDTATQLSQFEEGVFQANIDDEESIKFCLLEWLNYTQSKLFLKGMPKNIELVKYYSRKSQSKILMDILDSCVD
ncbi:polysaccharide deacetylase family protein [Simplicispira psychrophila]|uniref:polysaccharide deacetylase family protein n=1 Tax=Simplicispira psychrophila TaxID=80882 RepID=UPI0009FF1B06|nr:polysaccharide deacetylase family protein [Simplicispira psychrophila]